MCGLMVTLGGIIYRLIDQLIDTTPDTTNIKKTKVLETICPKSASGAVLQRKMGQKIDTRTKQFASKEVFPMSRG